LHPSGKIVLLLGYFTLALLFSTPAATLGLLLTAVGMAVMARALGNVRQIGTFLLMLTGICLLFWLLSGSGQLPLWRLGRLTIYREAVWYGLAMALRLDAMLITGIVFITCTSIEELRLGLCGLRLPYPAAFSIGLAFRLVPTFAETLEKAAQAQKARGFALEEGNFFTRFRKHAPLIIPVILVSLRNTDQLAMALEARGFGRAATRTSYLHHPWRVADTLCCLTALALLAVAILLHSSGIGVMTLQGG